ncbi:glycosyltransferase [Lactiplantibacillus plantarum]|uniref:glycosyltransferase n=1 Tax=Lactiplantibacillus plantarum TaxID=1590 RepID=UPI00189FE11E|nr:glycosyltransferase [Lactiplantibacillus plantarum]
MEYTSVIVTYNRKKLLVEAIQSLLTQTEQPKYIVIIDNASTDGTKEMVEQSFSDKRILYDRLNTNQGGSAGYYFGLRKTMELDAEWISISDDDAIFTPEFFAAINAGVKKYGSQNAFSGGVFLENGQLDALHRENIKNNNYLTVSPIERSEYEKDFSYDIFSFVGIVLNKQTVEKAGLPEKKYFIKFDDFEYALRCREVVPFINLANAKVIHKTTDPGRDVSVWKEYYVMRNRILSLEKHRGKALKIRLYEVYFLLRKLFAILLFKQRIKNAGALVRTYLQGFHDGVSRKYDNQSFLP